MTKSRAMMPGSAALTGTDRDAVLTEVEKAQTVKSDGIRDTIESVVVAFILAFVFRAFVVEAFVIPTGSMAPGLCGKHGVHRCAACGYPFAYGIIEPKQLDGGRMVYGTLSDRFTVCCPNCGWKGDGNQGLNDAGGGERVVPRSGDRILVLKWPFDIGGDLLGPKPWDVVVFKNPQDGDTNFIKRLLGLPGEVLEIIDGDAYTVPSDEVPPDILEALSRPPVPRSQGGQGRSRLTDEQHRRLADLLKIRRKTRIAEESLWIPHYDHDYKPDERLWRADSKDYPRWEPKAESGDNPWDARTPCVRFQPRDDQEHWLALAGKPIQDVYGYNNVFTPQHGPPLARDVGDVRVRFELFPRGTEGQLVVSLKRGNDDFRATIRANGTIDLDRRKPDGIPKRLQTSTIAPLALGKSLMIEFENVDYRVALRVDDAEVVATTDEQYRPDVHALLESERKDENAEAATVELGASLLWLDIRHLTVSRDVYYRSDSALGSGEDPRGSKNPFCQYPGWGTAGNPILLREDPPDYFCCGDNSPQSMDSRLWWEVCPMLRDRTGPNGYQNGTVPGDQMIGKAFFVYWPGGLPFSRETPAVIPSVGRMRIIR